MTNRNHHFQNKPLFFILLSLLLGSGSFLSGQTTGPESSGSARPIMEFPDDPFVETGREKAGTPAYTYTSPGFFTTQVNVDGSGQNIPGDAANEPSIAFDPDDPARMAIGWRHFNTISSNFRQAGFAYTTDGGATWTFPNVIDPGIFRSDPVLDMDANGNFYYNSLTVQDGDYWCTVYKSEDGGASWDDGTFAYGGDKQWFSIDKSSGPGAGSVYHYWSSVSICPPYTFTRSTDFGVSFEDCTEIPGNPHWGTTAIDADGNIYVSGSQGFNFVVVVSSTAQNSAQPMNWDYFSQVSLDGSIVGFGGYNCPNPSGLLGQTIISVDSSGGETHGNVYLLCSVERFSTSDPCDVMFARSTDGGSNWSSPIRVNDDEGSNAYQWFGTLSVAPDGRIDVIWLDNREFTPALTSRLYYAASWDGGFTWSANIPLGEPFDPHIGWPQQDKMGDYFDMFSDESGAHLAWANTLNGEQDVYYAFISTDITNIPVPEKNIPGLSLQNNPNPFRNNTTITYNVDQDGPVRLTILDLSGRTIHTLLDAPVKAGVHVKNFYAPNLKPGVYTCRLETERGILTKKIVRE